MSNVHEASSNVEVTEPDTKHLKVEEVCQTVIRDKRASHGAHCLERLLSA